MNAVINVKDVLLKKYSEKFGHDPEIVSYAPGSVEILGNHTDYIESYVLAAEINFGTYFAISARADCEALLK